LRGAGAGGFGVVTSFTFRAGSAPRMTDFHLTWSFGQAESVVAAWQGWAPTGPDELVADLELAASSDLATAPSVAVYGALVGGESDACGLLETLIAQVGFEPLTSLCCESSYHDSCAFQARLSASHENETARNRRFTKSEFFARPLPGQAIAGLLETVITGRGPREERSLQFAAWGGAYNRLPHDATAFAHRDQLFTLEHQMFVNPAASPAESRAAHEWVKRSWLTVHRYGSGFVYPNFRDPELVDWGRAYYGPNYARLLKIKAIYDPDNIFRFAQSLPGR
jgi:FAD/FMN-containing dehydrogenase